MSEHLPPATAIAAARQRAGKSFDEVAEMAEVAPQTVKNIEDGRDGLWSSVCRIIAALGGRVDVVWPDPAAPRVPELADGA
jgi:DNA-binding XRE family transcriptional regulator